LCAHGSQCPSLASDRRRRCALAVHIGRLYRSRHRAGQSFKTGRARCAIMVLDALFFSVGPPPSLALAVHIGRSYRSRHRAGQSFKSRSARCTLKVLDALLWRRTAAVVELSPSCHRAGRSFKSRRARCALMVLDALFGVEPQPSLCALAVHIGRLYRSRNRAGQSFKLRRARCALMVLDALLWPRAAAVAVCSRRPDIGRLYRAAGQSVKSRRAVSAHGARCPSLASDRRRRCALTVHIGRLYRSRHCAGQSFKSRRARCAFMVPDALFGVGPPPR
jgi:hypothetical protein